MTASLRTVDGSARAVPATARIGLTTLIVRDYGEAIGFFVGKLGFELVEDSPSVATDGTPKRWVVVAPPGGGPGLLLARAATPDQAAQIGNQGAGRVFLFLYTDDFQRDYNLFRDNGVTFTAAPRREPYGTVAVFRDVCGNLWDLIEPATAA